MGDWGSIVGVGRGGGGVRGFGWGDGGFGGDEGASEVSFGFDDFDGDGARDDVAEKFEIVDVGDGGGFGG